MSYGDLTNNGEGALDPSSAVSDPRRNRYPNPFFDLGQQYMPTTIKELFRWCTYYYYNSPLIGAAIKKISRYPITDLIFDDEHESVRDLWQTVLVDHLKLKDRLMEINLDYHTYGNAFVSLHKPFTRFLICKKCSYTAPIKNWNWKFQFGGFTFWGKCKRCGNDTACDVKDVPYKDIKGLKLIRWNPENIKIKYNDYTGRKIYMYTVPYKLRMSIQNGDKDIIEDIPMIVLEAVKARRMIKFNHENLKHLMAPTLAEQDQGWGKPAIIHVLKDMFYFTTLRRAQEAIAQEHILPFDMIYPMPNGQMDPYVHQDLGGWRAKIQEMVTKHRMDPNFKAVIPIPVGTVRVGGDGKSLMLNPEMQYLTQTIVGGFGLPSDMLFGGLNYTGSSISLRTLENDFIQNRSQLSDVVHWIKDDIRIWLGYPNVERVRFADFRMADDVQRNQQLIGLNAQRKVSDQTLLTELGYNYDQEIKKLIEEVYISNFLADLTAKGAAKSQGEASIIQSNYQEKIQLMAAQAQQEAQARGILPPPVDPNDPNAQQAQPGQQGQLPPGQEQPSPGGQGQAPAAAPQGSGQGLLPPAEAQPSGGVGNEWQVGQSEEPAQAPPAPAAAAGGAGAGGGGDGGDQIGMFVQKWVSQLLKMPPQDAKIVLLDVKRQMPDIGMKVEQAYVQAMATGGQPGGPVNTQAGAATTGAARAPTRGEVTGGGALGKANK